MRLFARPNQIDLVSPGRRDYHVGLRHDSLPGEHLMPLTVFVGPEAKPGRGLVAIGGNHGNEYEGPFALKWCLHELRADAVKGRIVVIPIVNPSAFAGNTRHAEADDGLNLNRQFYPPAKVALQGDTVSHRIVEFLRQQVWPHVHLVHDLHTGGSAAQFVEAAMFHRGANLEETLAAARRFRSRALLTMTNLNQATLTTDATRAGKIAVGTELGFGPTVSPVTLAKAKRGILANAIAHGQLSADWPLPEVDEPEQIEATMVDPDSFVAAPFAGYYEAKRRVGDLVEKGELLGWLHDFNRIDLEPEPIRAPLAGLLAIQPNVTIVSKGYHLAVVAVRSS